MEQKPLIRKLTSGGSRNCATERYFVALSILMVVASLLSGASAGSTIGGTISFDKTLTEAESPYEVTADLVISGGGRLTIQPGVWLIFHGGTRLQISSEGALIARGTPTKNIIMARNAGGVNKTEAAVRLIEGAGEYEGRLEVYNKTVGRWGTVCNANWTDADAKIVCQELGYELPRQKLTYFGAGCGDIGLSRVQCSGDEPSILKCEAQSWNNSGCSHTQDVGVICSETRRLRKEFYWGGVFFSGGNVNDSVLENVQVMAGGYYNGSDVAAVTIDGPGAPLLKRVVVKRSCSIAISLSVKGDVIFHDLHIEDANGGVTGSITGRFVCRKCHFDYIKERPAISLNGLIDESLSGSSSSAHTISFNGELNGHSQLVPIGISGLNFLLTNVWGSSGWFSRILIVPHGHGLRVFFQSVQLQDGIKMALMDGVTGRLIRQWTTVSVYKPLLSLVYSQKAVVYVHCFFSALRNCSATVSVSAFVESFRLDSKDVILANCTFQMSTEYATAVTLNRDFGYIRVEHSVFDLSKRQAGISVYGNGMSISILSNTFIKNSSSPCSSYSRFYWHFFAIMIHGYRSVTVMDCIISGFGISVNSVGTAKLAIADCTVTNSLSWAMYLSKTNWYYPSWISWKVEADSDSLEITMNRINANARGIYVGYYNRQSFWKNKNGWTVVSGNYFAKNRGTVIQYNQAYSSEHLAKDLIANNSFIENEVTSDPVLQIYVLGLRVVVENNDFLRNSGSSIATFSPENTFNSNRPVGWVIFRRNRLTGNHLTKPYSYDSQTNAVLMLFEGGPFFVAYYNVFDNPSVATEVGLRLRYSKSSWVLFDWINMTLNYWGTTDPVQIDKRIYDSLDSSILPTVLYSPYLLSSKSLDVERRNHTSSVFASILHGNQTVGGTLYTKFTLKASGSPYLVTKTVEVLEGGFLLIEAGVTLRFKQNTGIIVRNGILVAEGTKDKPIVMTAEKSRINLKQQITDIRLEKDEYISSSRFRGILQIKQGGSWRPVCYTETLSTALPSLVCSLFGFSSGSTTSSRWYPKIGTPIVISFECLNKTSDLDDCTFTFGNYSSTSRCLYRMRLVCFQRATASVPQTGWIGLAFIGAKMSSSLSFTEIISAGMSIADRVPALRSYYGVPSFNNVSIRYSQSTAFSVSSLTRDIVIKGLSIETAFGDGISISQPNSRNVIVDGVSITDVHGAGINLHHGKPDADPSLFQSICSAGRNLSVESEDGIFVGLHGSQHTRGLNCSLLLEGQPEMVLSLTAVSVQLYNKDRLLVWDGWSTNSSTLLKNYTGQIISDGSSTIMSSGNKLFVQLITGDREGAPGFLFRVALVAVGSSQFAPQAQLLNVRIEDVFDGIKVSELKHHLSLSNALISKASNYAISVSSHVGSVTISHTILQEAENGAIYLYGIQGNVIIRDNIISNSLVGVRVYNSCSQKQNSTVIIDSNVVTGSRQQGIYLSPDINNSNVSCKIHVFANQLSSNLVGLEIRAPSYTFTRSNKAKRYIFNLTNNVFTGNENTSLSVTDLLSSGSLCHAYNNTFSFHNRASREGSVILETAPDTLNFTSNRFAKNGGRYVVKFASLFASIESSVFVGNELVDNVISVHKTPSGEPLDYRNGVVVISKLSKIDMKMNVFNNPDSPYELAVQVPVQNSRDAIVNAARNYWGHTTVSDIQARVYEFGTCSRLARVDFLPFLGSPFGNTVPPGGKSTVQRKGLVGGVVHGKIVLEQSRSPYTVTKDISVLPESQLVIEEGVELRFANNVGILVEGQLIAKGSLNKPIRMSMGNQQPEVQFAEGDLRLNGDSKLTGIAEIYHSGIWAAVCNAQDPLNSQTFPNDYIALVVCRILFNGNIRYGYLSGSKAANETYYIPGWLQHVLCTGYEETLSACQNYEFQSSTCTFGALRVACVLDESQQRELENRHKSLTYWSGIRFSTSMKKASVMENVEISRAGMANGQFSPAIQAMGHNLTLLNVTVQDSAWTGIEITNGIETKLIKVTSTGNDGSGISLVNSRLSAVKNSKISNNTGNGLELTVNSILQRMWNLPVTSDQIVDICSKSGSTLSTAKPFYLRFNPRLLLESSSIDFNCFVKAVSSEGFVPSFHLLALSFGNKIGELQLDGNRFYYDDLQRPGLHYVAQNLSMIVEINYYNYDYYYDDVYDYYDYDYDYGDYDDQYDPDVPYSENDYILAYVQQYPTGPGEMSDNFQSISQSDLSLNSMYGLSADLGEIPYDRFDLVLSETSVVNNSLGGINVTMSPIQRLLNHSLSFIRNLLSTNGGGWLNGSEQTGKGGSAMSIRSDTASVYILNNVVKNNRQGGICLKLSVNSSAYVIDNGFQSNSFGPDLYLNSGNTFQCVGNDFKQSQAKNFDLVQLKGVANLYLTNCTFSENAGLTMVRLYCENDGQYFINGNSFAFNLASEGIANLDSLNATNVESGLATTGNNSFNNPLSNLEMNISNNIEYPVNAKQNWWGTASVLKVKTRIQDDTFRAQILPILEKNPLNLTSYCRLGWVGYDCGCHIYVGGALDWCSAVKHCEDIGGSLTTPGSADSETFLKSLPSIDESKISSQEMWLGVRNQGNGWQTLDRMPFNANISHWKAIYTKNETGCLMTSSGGWKAVRCSRRFPFVCSQHGVDRPVFELSNYTVILNSDDTVDGQVLLKVSAKSGRTDFSLKTYEALESRYDPALRISKSGSVKVADASLLAMYPNAKLSFVVQGSNSDVHSGRCFEEKQFVLLLTTKLKSLGTSVVGPAVGGSLGSLIAIIFLVVLIMLAAKWKVKRTSSSDIFQHDSDKTVLPEQDLSAFADERTCGNANDAFEKSEDVTEL